MASSGVERAARPSSQGRALEPAGNCRPREMTVAPKGEQNPAYHAEPQSYKGLTKWFGQPILYLDGIREQSQKCYPPKRCFNRTLSALVMLKNAISQ